MKKGLTEIVFILDKSGSMEGLEKDTIGGFNLMLDKQKAIDGEAHIMIALFDNDYELLHDRIDIKAVSSMSQKEYQIGGLRAFLDAIDKTIHKICNTQRNTPGEYRAEKVMFIIITDGEEKASREYSADKVKSQIERQKIKYGWEFIFLGANINAIETASKFGISTDRGVGYLADSKGIELNFKIMSETLNVSEMDKCCKRSALTN